MGPNPPFHTPVFVVRDFLAEGLVDVAHIVQVPIVLGRGVRLWDGLQSIDDLYEVETVASPSGVVHFTLTRRTEEQPS